MWFRIATSGGLFCDHCNEIFISIKGSCGGLDSVELVDLAWLWIVLFGPTLSALSYCFVSLFCLLFVC
jgi:hypothetical protein